MGIIIILLASEIAIGFLQSLLGVQGAWIIIIGMAIMAYSSLNIIGLWSAIKWWFRTFLLFSIGVVFCGWQSIEWGEYYINAVKNTHHYTDDLILLNGIEGMKYGGGVLGKTVVDILEHNDTYFKDYYMLSFGVLVILLVGSLFRK